MGFFENLMGFGELQGLEGGRAGGRTGGREDGHEGGRAGGRTGGSAGALQELCRSCRSCRNPLDLRRNPLNLTESNQNPLDLRRNPLNPLKLALPFLGQAILVGLVGFLEYLIGFGELL